MVKHNNNNNDGDDEMLKKIVSRPATTATRVLQTSKSRVELSKPEKVPEPCRSCGRNDLPERFHTHGPTQDHPGEVSGVNITKILKGDFSQISICRKKHMGQN